MRPRLAVLLSAALSAGAAFGQTTLDWSSSSWSDASGAHTGTYNALSGASGTTAKVNTLTYDFGAGLTATVSVDLMGSFSKWQSGSGVYSDPLSALQYAPRYFAGGDVFALGVEGRSTDGKIPAGATLTITFSQAVQGLSFRIGDIDAGGQRDLVTVSSDAPALFYAVSGTNAPTVTGSQTLQFTARTGEEATFGAAAGSAWASVSTGDALVNTVSINLSGLVANGKASSSAHGIWLSDISIAAIPEPSTYALFLGLGTLGVAVWRSRRR